MLKHISVSHKCPVATFFSPVELDKEVCWEGGGLIRQTYLGSLYGSRVLSKALVSQQELSPRSVSQ